MSKTYETLWRLQNWLCTEQITKKTDVFFYASDQNVPTSSAVHLTTVQFFHIKSNAFNIKHDIAIDPIDLGLTISDTSNLFKS